MHAGMTKYRDMDYKTMRRFIFVTVLCVTIYVFGMIYQDNVSFVRLNTSTPSSSAKVDASLATTHIMAASSSTHEVQQSFNHGNRAASHGKALHGAAAMQDKYYKFIQATDTTCNKSVRLGNDKDGGWNMCITGNYLPGTKCLVYSFGINYDWSFDVDISTTYGCHVKSYDPSMKTFQKPMNYSDLVEFFPVGLSGKERLHSKGWPLKPFGSLLRSNGDSNKIIDYLKFDIESSEWGSLETMLADENLKRVKQLGFEVHSARQVVPLHKEINILMKLKKFGFLKWYVHDNPACSRFGTQYMPTLCSEMVYINSRFSGIV